MSMYVDMPSVYITILGSVFICMMKFNLGQFLMAFKVTGKAFGVQGDKLDDLITKAVELADAARKGAFWLWRRRRSPHLQVKKASTCWWTAMMPTWRAVMEKDIELTSERHATAIKVFPLPWGSRSGHGMIGTLVGLVAMLANMSDPNPSVRPWRWPC